MKRRDPGLPRESFSHINTLAWFTGVADGYQPMTGEIGVKTMSHDPLPP